MAPNVVICLEKSYNASCRDVVENEDDRAEDSNEVAEKAAIEAVKAAENAGKYLPIIGCVNIYSIP